MANLPSADGTTRVDLEKLRAMPTVATVIDCCGRSKGGGTWG